MFKSVCGYSFTVKRSRVTERTLFAELALLARHRRVSPDNVYYYAVEDKSSRIEGFVIHDIPQEAMAEIDHYEGKRYKRQTVKVDTSDGSVETEAYLVSRESMKKYFGDRFHVNLIHELWLRKRIEKFLKKVTRPGDRTLDAEIERQADRELLATTERDLIISHYHTDAVSDYYLEHELWRPRPSVKSLYDDEKAVPFIENYLDLVIKQVLLNQLEEKIYSRYRFEIDHMRSSQRYFNRSVSLLIALQMLNINKASVDLIIQQRRSTMPYKDYDLFDYIKYAVGAARSLFDHRVAHNYLGRVKVNIQSGLTPLGAEIELSNLGFAAVEPQRSIRKLTDPQYDGFRYFHDFKLDVLSWKLGGYIDDHSGSTGLSGLQGFLEMAPGRLNVEGELSRPATADPWLLNQLIGEIVTFYDVRPHSLHLSFQLRKKQIGSQQILPLEFVKCLLALGGDLAKRDSRRLWISRMQYDEIKQHIRGEELVFARTNKRSWYMGEDEIADKPPVQAMAVVQQYKFIRLQKTANYEPLILCLKGLQFAYNPGDYLTAEQLQSSPSLRADYEELKRWAQGPEEISLQTISRFLNTVRDGLMIEYHHRPAHQLYYINWALGAIEVQLKMFNKRIREFKQ
ncbi:MAG: gamma-glutamylcyclotransferase [Sedimentisphaerales bacterium]|nr:gamma-glutamylcyclotransferase [Sedimentisphaerales bacterium]